MPCRGWVTRGEGRLEQQGTLCSTCQGKTQTCRCFMQENWGKVVYMSHSLHEQPTRRTPYIDIGRLQGGKGKKGVNNRWYVGNTKNKGLNRGGGAERVWRKPALHSQGTLYASQRTGKRKEQ